jgi:hypothetical protein
MGNGFSRGNQRTGGENFSAWCVLYGAYGFKGYNVVE